MVSVSSSPDSVALLTVVIEQAFNSVFPSMETGATAVNSSVHVGYHLVEIHEFVLNFGVAFRVHRRMTLFAASVCQQLFLLLAILLQFCCTNTCFNIFFPPIFCFVNDKQK